MNIFHPYATRQLVRIHRGKTRFAHYTSAEVALSIIEKRKVWLRLTSCMNDYLEVDHGLNCLSRAYKDEHGQRLKGFLDKMFPGLSGEIEKDFDAWNHGLKVDSFVACLSEHAGEGRESEDQHGRLSMWRGYGHSPGAAMVVNQAPFWMTSMALGLYTTPVAYLDDVGYGVEMGILATSLEASADHLRTWGRDYVKSAVIQTFTAAAISTKHPGFSEEQEWRVVRTPNFGMPCPLERVTMTVNGVPQEILLLELKDDPAKGVVGLDLATFLDRIIIGPGEYGMATYYALTKALDRQGVADAGKKVKFSGLPLRASTIRRP